MSGILLSKTFGQQQASIEKFGRESTAPRRPSDPAADDRALVLRDDRHLLLDRAGLRLPPGRLADHRAATRTSSLGTIVAFTTLQSRLFFPLGQLLNVQVEIQGALALFDRIFEYLEMEPEIRDAPDAVDLDPATLRGDVRFRQVTFRYPSAPPPWRPPPRSNRPRQRVARCRSRSGRSAWTRSTSRPCPASWSPWSGPSGAGKTTTTYLIPRLYDVDGGAVEIDGIDVRRIRLESLGREIGVVTQETYLFHASVLDNLRYAKPDATMEEIEAAVARGGDARPRHGAARCL